MMRKNYKKILTLMAAAVAIVSCSDDVIQTTDFASMEEAMAPSEISIALDASSESLLSSKAAIRSDEGAFDADVALFMLATHPTPTPFNQSSRFWSREYALDCSWNQNDKSHAVYMQNYQAKASYKVDGDPKQGSKITIPSKDRQFFPVGSMHAYNFYAYAPYSDTVKCYADTVKVIWRSKPAGKNYKGYKLDGTKDFIYASAVPGDINNPINSSYQNIAWSANYFRYQANRDQATDEPLVALRPKLNFTHKMMQLMFSIQPGGVDEEGKPVDEKDKGDRQLSYDDACNMEIESITICNVPDTIFMTIAQRQDRSHDGELTYSSDSRNSEYDLKQYIKKNGAYFADNNFVPVVPKSKTEVVGEIKDIDEEGNEYVKETLYSTTPLITKLGGPDDTHRQGIILPALTEADRKSVNGAYRLKVRARYPINAENPDDIKTYECIFDLDSDPEKSNKYFQQGYSYEVNLRIYGPDIIKPETSERTGWQEVVTE